MARWQTHFRNVTDVPCRDDVTATCWIVAQTVDQGSHLVNSMTRTAHRFACIVDIGTVYRPRAPLHTVNRAEFAGTVTVLARPIVPQVAAVFVQPFGVVFAAQEPQHFEEGPSVIGLLDRHQWERLAQVERHVVVEDGQGALAGAVVTLLTFVQDAQAEFDVLFHCRFPIERCRWFLTPTRTRISSRRSMLSCGGRRRGLLGLFLAPVVRQH